MPRRLRCGLLLAALLVGPALPAAMTGTASAASTTSFAWEADRDFQGDLAFRFAIDLSAATSCELVFTFAGHSTEAPLRSWTLSTERRIGHAFDRELESQTHVGDQIEFTESEPRPFTWGTRLTVRGFFAGHETWTAAGFDLTEARVGFPGEPLEWLAPASVEFTCEAPFTIEATSGSNHVLGFTEDHLRGGVGASEEDETFVVDGQQGYAVSLGDRVGDSFDEETVSVQYQTGAQEGNSTTEAMLLHPNGIEHWRDRSSASPSPATRVFDGEPGRYELAFARTASGPATELAGIVAGLQPVATLEDLA